ncbi:uncharacterized protein LOC142353147 [Convolutriloba macropyga]|uniref:uncharacterized protein LOC142353147 n=1 Tax=Convolutriloba macropyga TaxID=536237 RepID=UPI003F52319D
MTKPTRTLRIIQFVLYSFFFTLRSVCHVFQIYLAKKYWDYCPAEHRLPKWNLVDAIFGLTFLTIEAGEKVILYPSIFAKLKLYVRTVSVPIVKRSCTISRGLCAVFLGIWFFYGNLLVFAVSYELVHDQNSTTSSESLFSLVTRYNQSESLIDIWRHAQHILIPMDSWSSQHVCNAFLYWASFWLIVGSYILIGVVFGIAFSLACCALPVMKVFYCCKHWLRKQGVSSDTFIRKRHNNYGTI